MSRRNSDTRAIAVAMLLTATTLGAQTKTETQRGPANPTLTVIKIIVPAGDAGRFNLQIDGLNSAYSVGNNGTTGAITTRAGTHSVSEVAADNSGTDLANYTTTFGGDCSATGSVTLAAGDNKTCIITNKRHVARPTDLAGAQVLIQQLPTKVTQLQVIKLLVPADDPGRFTLRIDGIVPGGPFGGAVHVGNNGTTDFVTVTAGAHVVSEWGSMVNGTQLSNYTASYSSNCPGGHITLQAGASEICTITNTRSHGTWSEGPGTYDVTLCSVGSCTIHGAPGQVIPITFEVWGAGGGGGGGEQSKSSSGGNGGGGGGGGGYGKVTVNGIIPTQSGTREYEIVVGLGGTAGTRQSCCVSEPGGPGGDSEVNIRPWRVIVMKATGGQGGKGGFDGVGSGAGGLGGSVTASAGAANNIAGLIGANGAIVTGCNGGGGGAGGVGGGPGAINNGGNGGGGGYYNGGMILLGGCTAQSDNNGLAPGLAGKNGLVKVAW